MRLQKKLLVISLCLAFQYSTAQKDMDPCLQPQYHEKCVSGVTSVFDDFIYLRSRPFSRDMSGDKFVVSLKRNTLYLFDICQGVKARAKLTLYDADTEEPIASTYDITAERYNRVLSFYSNSRSGRYLISVSFDESPNDCVVIVYGMIRENIDTYVKVAE